jgi:hypothetical protein
MKSHQKTTQHSGFAQHKQSPRSLLYVLVLLKYEDPVEENAAFRILATYNNPQILLQHVLVLLKNEVLRKTQHPGFSQIMTKGKKKKKKKKRRKKTNFIFVIFFFFKVYLLIPNMAVNLFHMKSSTL